MGIVTHQNAMLALKNAIIHAAFPKNVFKQFSNKMVKLQECTYEEVKKQSNFKDGFHYLKDHEKEFNEKFFTCLLDLNAGNTKNMYKMIKSFDGSLGEFVDVSNKKHK